MDRHRDYYTKIKSEREQLIPHGITYMWNLKCDTNEPIYKTGTDWQTQKTNLLTKEETGKEG